MISPATNPDRLTKREKVALNRTRADRIRAGFDSMDQQRKIFIDCSFRSVMDVSEINSLCLQLQECYCHLRMFGSGIAQMLVGSVDEDLKAALSKQGGDQWAVHYLPESIETLMDKLGQDAIFLSPDAVKELTVAEIQCSTNCFIIGGIVDRKVSRNETSHKAARLGLRCRKLPIDVETCRNKIFNVDTVFMYLLKCFTAVKLDSREDMVNLLHVTLPDRKIKTHSSIPERSRPSLATKLVTEGSRIKLTRYSVVELFQ